MGLYNEVNFTCPICGNTITEQTNSGGCSMKTFSQNSVPIAEVEGIREAVYCECCETRFRVFGVERIELSLVEQTND